MRAPRVVLTIGILAVIATLAALPAAQTPGFEVSSVKANNSARDGGQISGPTPGRFTVTNIPLRFIVLYAYDLKDHQLVGMPEWTSTARFDISATYPTPATPSVQELRTMIQGLLAVRFKFAMHREQRELPAYSLVLARRDGRLGPQMTRSDVDCVKWLAEKRPQIGAGGPSPVAPGGQRPACMMMATRRFLTGGTRTVSELSNVLQSMVGRPVVNNTGLTGTFDMDMQWTPDVGVTANATSPPPDDGASIFTALREQLGLTLESTRAPFDVVVVDRVERPTED